jgi:anti-anti-sigma factor
LADFQIAWHAVDDVCVIGIHGELDVVTSRQLDDVLAHTRKTFTRFVLDLSGVEFLDTSSLAVIVGHWKNLEEAGGWLALAGPRYQSAKSLWITGLADRIPLHPDVETAIEARQQG